MHIPEGNSPFSAIARYLYDLIFITVLTWYVFELPHCARHLCTLFLKAYLCSVIVALCGLI